MADKYDIRTDNMKPMPVGVGFEGRSVDQLIADYFLISDALDRINAETKE